MGKSFRKSFNGRNLQQMTRVTKGLCLYKNSDPKGLSALYTCIKTWKIMYKIRLQRWNLQQMGKVTRLFCWHQDFVHKELSAPAPGLYTCIKTWKIMYKIRLQRWNLQQMGKVTRLFCWHQDFVHKGLSAQPRGYIHVVYVYINSDPKGLSAPAPGLYTCIKNMKNYV